MGRGGLALGSMSRRTRSAIRSRSSRELIGCCFAGHRSQASELGAVTQTGFFLVANARPSTRTGPPA